MLRMLIALLVVGLLSVHGARADVTTTAEGETAAPPAESEASESAQAADDPAPTEGGDAAAAQPFSFEDVVERARQLAATPFEAPRAELPEALNTIDYDAFRHIRYRPDRALWRDERMFEIQFFHLGFLYQVPVRINIIDGGVASEAIFDPGMFDYSQAGLDQQIPSGLGFAGFRIHYPLHEPAYKDEIAVFLGASYFRLLGRDQQFGASARGLAIDTAHPRGEEFPIFREFWLVKPEANAHTLTIYALLDSNRVTGAYRFVIDPGTATAMDVTAEVFARQDMDKIGIAPLTSMYLFGESDSRRFDDFRPEVHDSDGLLMQTGAGAWIWRPLENHPELKVSAFMDTNPRGFGLLQRDRDFARYLDLEAGYHRRPSLWVEPRGEWGPGAVELVEIPLNDETNDNIVAYWTPEKQLRAGETMAFSYRIQAMSRMPSQLTVGHVERTLTGAPSAWLPSPFPENTRLFVIDYDGGDLPNLSPEQPVEAQITTSSGRIIDQIVQKIPQGDGWRVAFRVDPEGSDTVDMTVRLTLYGEPVAEDWAYLWLVRP